MKQSAGKIIKTVFILVSPILLFFILAVPYKWLNQAVLVDWLGCGCPQVDEFGNIIHSYFNANDFTTLFWLFIALCATVIAVFLSKRIPKEKMWLKILYVACILLVSLLLAYTLRQMLLWN